MRLQEFEKEAISKAFLEVFQEGEIYLFGSRVDDNQKGGDIDLYLVTPKKRQLLQNKLKFLAKVKMAIGDQKIDVVFSKDASRLIEQEARRWGKRLFFINKS